MAKTKIHRYFEGEPIYNFVVAKTIATWSVVVRSKVGSRSIYLCLISGRPRGQRRYEWRACCESDATNFGSYDYAWQVLDEADWLAK